MAVLIRFLIWCFLTWFFFEHLSFGLAIIATATLLFFIYPSNNQDKSPPIQAKTELTEPISHDTHLTAVALLYLELKQQYRLGHLSEEHYNPYQEQVDILLSKQLNLTKSKRQVQLEIAWVLLKKQIGNNLGPPPWRSLAETTPENVPPQEPAATETAYLQSPVSDEKPEQQPPEVDFPPAPEVPPLLQSSTGSETKPLSYQAITPSVLVEEHSTPEEVGLPSIEENQVTHIPASPEVMLPIQSNALPEEQLEITQSPVPTQKKTSTWLSRVFSRDFITHILMPFLWQNLGWFIGGFCFISGSIFLVTYTTGFAKAVTVFVILGFYTLLLFWGSYQIRRRHPKLLTTSYVLTTLAVLLVPLDFASATRLIQTAISQVWLISLTILGVLIVAIVLSIALRLASGMMERHLQGEHPYLLIALASLQLAIPIIYFIPHWFVLAGLHVGLLSLLGYALWRFSQQWLYTIFTEQQQITYYAAGTLVYAAVVSFIHSIWGSGITLPAGYAGPFLMTLCLLLLHVDIQFKQWVHKQALLSHFSFVIYGLSVVAIFYAWVGHIPLILTLMVGSVIYGMMLWNYLTLPPLYLLLACLSGLYGLLILQYFPYHWYFLLSLPGLGSLLWLHRFAQQRESVALAIICCRVILTLGIGLFIWSLYHATPSVSALLTAITATVITTYRLQKSVSTCQLTTAQPYQYYALTGLITVTLAYTPLYLGLSWIAQFSSGLLILSLLWSAGGLLIRTEPKSAAVFLNSALLSLMVSVVLVTLYYPTFLPWLLFVVSGILLWLSLSLYSRALFYVTLLALGVAGVLFKHYYLPNSSGRGITLVALGIWMLLWWLHDRFIYLPQRFSLSKTEQNMNKPNLTLLGILPLSPNTYSNRFELLKPPLEQTMVLLWLVGLLQTLKPMITLVFMNNLEPFWTQSWGIALIWNAVVTVLIAGYTQLLQLISLAIMLLMGALWVLSPVSVEWFFCFSVIYAAVIWAMTLFILARPLSWLTFLGWQVTDNFQQKIEHIIYWTVVAILFVSLVGVGLVTFDELESISSLMPLIITLAIIALFAAWVGWRYQSPLHSYVVIWGSISSLLLLSLELTSWLIVIWLYEPAILFVPTLLAIGLSILAQRIVNSFIGTLYTRPLYFTAYLLYVFTLISIFWLWEHNVPFEQLELIELLILLAIGQLPLLRPISTAATIRGVGIALLLSLAFFHWAAVYPQDNLVFLTLLWALVLWGMGHYGLPWFNNRWSPWSIEPYFWPILGLGLMVTVLSWVSWQQENVTWQTIIPVTLYLILMLRNTYWKWLPWVVGFTLMISGSMVLSDDTVGSLFGIILWINFLLWLSQFLQRYETTPWQFQRLSQPLFLWSFLVINLQLLGLSLITTIDLFNFTRDFEPRDFWHPFVIVWAILLNFSCFHIANIKKHLLFTHAVMLSLVNTALWVLIIWFSVPLSFSLWTVGSLLFYAKMHRQIQPIWLSPLSIWLSLSFIAVLLIFLATFSLLSTNERLLILALLTGLSFSFGWLNIRDQARSWLVSSAVLFWSFLHLIWLTEWSQAQVVSLLPWYALQNGLLAWSAFWLSSKNVIVAKDRSKQFHWLLTGLARFLVSFSLLFLLLAESGIVSVLWNGHEATITLAHNLAIFLTHLILISLWWQYHHGRATQDKIFIYGLAILIAWLGIYLRLLWVGFAPLTVWDTAVLMGSSYVLLVLWHRYPTYPLYRLTLVLPALAVLTVPLQLESIRASSALIAAAVLYLLMPRRSQQSLPLYLGLLALNIGCYLWIPSLVHDYKLLQLYTVPAAISLLFMLQLHRLELKPSVLNAIRLVALSMLYASATLDVFLQEALSIFILALLLSLVGIMLGIALRIRAFLYSGTVFLVLNVVGQLIQFYPEERLGKAIVLMVLGGFITGGMIWFNIQREALLERIRLMRTNLATWA